ncbi:hypothetical protein DL770_009569 [Monosporascus sp. CRB-9-2]|nr:hypothetical protein DL770_009569 [Monosporascus sp. CRB-9-2]
MPKRGRGRARKTAVPVRGGWDVLPHGLGAAPNAGTAPESLEQMPTLGTATESLTAEQITLATTSGTTPATASARASATTTATTSTVAMVNEPKKRKRHIPTDNLPNETKLETEINEEPEAEPEGGLRRSKRIRAIALNSTTPQETPAEPASQKRSSKAETSHTQQEDSHPGQGSEQDAKPKKEKRKPKKTKDNPYGLTPGETPFPYWMAPTPAQCEEVYKLLADMHDDVQPQAPEVIPAPSIEVAGCGEVPSVLDALLRTLLSGATTFDNADKMIKGLVEKFGILPEGIGKGSIDWNKVRLSPLEDVVDAICVGGLGNNKAKSIKAILDMVHQETIERRDAYLEERETGIAASVIGAAVKTKGQKDLEIEKVEKNILSLDHIRDLSVDEAMKEFTKYPGVGVKTSACVILFCLQRPCFAVDTHVDKFSRWLRWVPEKATVDDIFSHLEVRCPDHLKYGLHQLFIRHGKTCGKCRRGTVEGTEEWKTLVCPLEHLLDRFDKRQSKAKLKVSKKKREADNAIKEGAGAVKDEEADGLDGIEGGIATTGEGKMSDIDDDGDGGVAQDADMDPMAMEVDEGVVGHSADSPDSELSELDGAESGQEDVQ